MDSEVKNLIQLMGIAEKFDYIGEPVSQLEHALQCAYFADQSNHSEEVILACLFHDIGHFASATKQRKMNNLGVFYHEWIGAKLAYDYGFSAKVALLIGYHVDAKRYLASKKDNYYDRLSIASKSTMTFQGGPMSTKEMEQFENHPYFKEILQVRINDEKGKDISLQVPHLHYYYPRIKNHFRQNKKTASRKFQVNLKDYINNEWIMELKKQLEISAAIK